MFFFWWENSFSKRAYSSVFPKYPYIQYILYRLCFFSGGKIVSPRGLILPFFRNLLYSIYTFECLYLGAFRGNTILRPLMSVIVCVKVSASAASAIETPISSAETLLSSSVSSSSVSSFFKEISGS